MTRIKICECKIWCIEGFFSYGSVKNLGGSGSSNLASLGVGWEEQVLHFVFPSVGGRFILYVSKCCRICLIMYMKYIIVNFSLFQLDY